MWQRNLQKQSMTEAGIMEQTPTTPFGNFYWLVSIAIKCVMASAEAVEAECCPVPLDCLT